MESDKQIQSKRIEDAISFIEASRLNDCNNDDILRIVQCGSVSNNVQSELITNLIVQKLA